MTISKRLLCAASSVLFLGAQSACITTHNGRPVGVQHALAEGPWLEPSPMLEEQIEAQLERLPWTHGLERVELIRWFAAAGEPAYDYLLERIGDANPDISASVLAALGSTNDRRLVPYIQEVALPEGASLDLELEKARTLVRLGDWSSMPALIRGLRDERQYTRSLCIRTLSESTRQDFDYDPRAETEAREASVSRWEAWWLSRSSDVLLAKQP